MFNCLITPWIKSEVVTLTQENIIGEYRLLNRWHAWGAKLKFCLATATHNFKRVKITYVNMHWYMHNLNTKYASLVALMVIFYQIWKANKDAGLRVKILWFSNRATSYRQN